MAVTTNDTGHFLRRENILVLDIFFEALNYETIEQKKAYEVAALLGKSECLLHKCPRLMGMGWWAVYSLFPLHCSCPRMGRTPRAGGVRPSSCPSLGLSSPINTMK